MPGGGSFMGNGGSFAQRDPLGVFAGGSFRDGTGSLYPSFVDPQGSFLGNQAGGQPVNQVYDDVILEEMNTEVYESVNRIDDFDAKNEENLIQMSSRFSIVSQANLTQQS